MKKPNQYWKPCPIRVDTAGRPLDAAGKLIKQGARADLKKTDHEDPTRKIEFTNS
jgi:hypothetical protein